MPAHVHPCVHCKDTGRFLKKYYFPSADSEEPISSFWQICQNLVRSFLQVNSLTTYPTAGGLLLLVWCLREHYLSLILRSVNKHIKLCSRCQRLKGHQQGEPMQLLGKSEGGLKRLFVSAEQGKTRDVFFATKIITQRCISNQGLMRKT